MFGDWWQLGELDCDRSLRRQLRFVAYSPDGCNISSDEGKFLRRQLLLALTEDDRHTQEVQRLWNLVKDDLKPTRLFNAAIGPWGSGVRIREKRFMPPLIGVLSTLIRSLILTLFTFPHPN